jgi:hypothetical protein
MSEQLINSVVTVLLGIIGIATLAVILSKQSNTATVISQSGSSFSQALSTALSPITGAQISFNSATLE